MVTNSVVCLLHFMLSMGVNAQERVQGAVANKGGQHQYTGNNQQHYAEGAGDYVGQVKNNDQSGDDEPYGPVGRTHVSFHTASF